MDKKETRKLYREIRKNIPLMDKKRESEVICENIINMIKEEGYSKVLLYAALPEEVNVDTVFDRLKDKVIFYFPRVCKDVMEFYHVEDWEDLETGNFGVREPKAKCASIDYNDDKYLMIVPGMAFDKNGYRLGYGKGFYDKYLNINKHKKIKTVGICFGKCLVDELPHDEYDVKVNKVLI